MKIIKFLSALIMLCGVAACQKNTQPETSSTANRDYQMRYAYAGELSSFIYTESKHQLLIEETKKGLIQDAIQNGEKKKAACLEKISPALEKSLRLTIPFTALRKKSDEILLSQFSSAELRVISDFLKTRIGSDIAHNPGFFRALKEGEVRKYLQNNPGSQKELGQFLASEAGIKLVSTLNQYQQEFVEYIQNRITNEFPNHAGPMFVAMVEHCKD